MNARQLREAKIRLEYEHYKHRNHNNGIDEISYSIIESALNRLDDTPNCNRNVSYQYLDLVLDCWARTICKDRYDCFVGDGGFKYLVKIASKKDREALEQQKLELEEYIHLLAW